MSTNSPVEQEWAEAVRIVNFYMQTEGLNPNQLALKANLNRSILSRFLGKKSFPDLSSMLALYITMQGKLDWVQKSTFQRVAGIEKLLSDLETHAVYLVNSQPEVQAHNPYKAGLQQMAIAETSGYWSWEEAIIHYRRAEELFQQTAISHAAKAACQIVQLQINLGEYVSAHQEVERIQLAYAKTMDVETEAELYRLQGWLDFHVGNYRRSKEYFEKQLSLAKEADVEHLQVSAHGFLGRIYLEFAHHASSRKERISLFHRALEFTKLEVEFETRRGSDEDIAMHLFRLSELHQASESYRDANDLRKRSRDVSGTVPLPQLDVEEARLHLDEYNFADARFLVEGALDILEDQKYARGISQALQLWANIELKDGQPATAFELSVVALCAAPSDSDSRGKAMWNFVKGIDRNSVWQGKWKSYEAYLRHLHESAMARTGNFELLKSISFLHENDTLDKVFSILQPVVDHK